MMKISSAKKISAAATMAVFGAVHMLHAEVVNITQGSTTGYELTDGNTYVIQDSVAFSNSTAGGSGMSVADGATVVIYIPQGVTLTAIGANGSGQIGGGAGIRVPETATLVITGDGIINATGGNAGNGENGADGLKGGTISCKYSSSDATDMGKGSSGAGGSGGSGGGGAGSAIGGRGAWGGAGGIGADSRTFTSYVLASKFCGDGNDGQVGLAGLPGDDMGTCYVLGRTKLMVDGGAAGKEGMAGGNADWTYCLHEAGPNKKHYHFAACGGGGGGGGGAGNKVSCAIGGGGSSGGGGGGGGSGATTAQDDQLFGYHPMVNANGGAGVGGSSMISTGLTGNVKGKTDGGYYRPGERNYYYGGEGGDGGAAGAEGAAGVLYVSPTVTIDVEREKLSATTHPAAQYKITFDANGGQLVPSDASVTATLGCELPDCIPAPTKSGFAFDGWKSSAGEEYYGVSGAKNVSSYPVVGDVILYAQWKVVGHTSTTPVPVPYSYFNENCPTLLSAHGGDYEAVALSTAMNGCDKVWECYVSGISPTNKDSRFTAIIKMGTDGKPILSWKPPLNGENADGAGIREGVRSYSVYGKQTLDGAAEEWKPVAEGDEGNYRFFKVGVGMPEKK